MDIETRTPVERQVRVATTVSTIDEALSFVVQQLDRLGLPAFGTRITIVGCRSFEWDDMAAVIDREPYTEPDGTKVEDYLSVVIMGCEE